MNKLILILIISYSVLSCQNKSVDIEKPIEVREPIEGLWKLHLMEIKDSLNNWQEWRDGMKGYLLYDGNGHMALHLIPSNYEETTLTFPNFTDSISEEALKHITNNYNYFGTYKIDNDSNIVSHYRISHSNPGEWYTTVRRKFSFNGDTLVVKPVEEKNAKLRLKLLRQD